KGLVFVQLYGCYEYCVVQSVQASIRALNAHAIPHQTLRPGVLAVVTDPECVSLADAGVRTAWERRIALFTKVRSTDPAVANDAVFPRDGSHFRVPQLLTIWQVFGAGGSPLPHPRYGQRVNELVENRNAIAHGR